MTKLNNIGQAIIGEIKLTDYLLLPTHPDGGAKARFLGRFGFSRANPDALRAALRAHAKENEITASHETKFGTIFEIDGPLPSPDGRHPLVRVVWMLEIDAMAPRLITLVPLTARQPEPRNEQ